MSQPADTLEEHQTADGFAADWSSQFNIDAVNLEEEVIRQPASFSYYSTRLAKSKGQVELAKLEVERKKTNRENH